MIVARFWRILYKKLIFLEILIVLFSCSAYSNFDSYSHELEGFPSLADLNCDQSVDISDMMLFISCLLNQNEEDRSCLLKLDSCDSLEDKIPIELIDFDENKIADYREDKQYTSCITNDECGKKSFCNPFGYCQNIDCKDFYTCTNSNLCAHTLCTVSEEDEWCSNTSCTTLCDNFNNHTRNSASKLEIGQSIRGTICSQYEKDYFKIDDFFINTNCGFVISIENTNEEFNFNIELYDSYGKNLEEYKRLENNNLEFFIPYNSKQNLNFPLYARIGIDSFKLKYPYDLYSEIVCN